MLHNASPTLHPAFLPTGNAPPTPPQNDSLDDIYGSEPSSPVTSSLGTALVGGSHDDSHEILSDLPSRQRALDTDAYREGLADSKGRFVQEGFDEGYSLGANLGMLVGYILGVLQGCVAAFHGHDEVRRDEASQALDSARKALAIQELLGKAWVDEEGIWKWRVEGSGGEYTFQEVAEQHPVIRSWMAKVRELANEWGLDLEAVERRQGAGDDVEQS